MDITGIYKADILAALFNNAQPQGMGFLHYKKEHVMDKEEAENLLSQHQRFDYLEGRVMKVNLDSDDLNTSGYNMDNGEGFAEKVIETLSSGETIEPKDHERNELIRAGIMPKGCTLPIELFVMLKLSENPCNGCNQNRSNCDGTERINVPDLLRNDFRKLGIIK